MTLPTAVGAVKALIDTYRFQIHTVFPTSADCMEELQT